jgi:anti-sigma28 factor (negative regulator of flagellin synthesis)
LDKRPEQFRAATLGGRNTEKTLSPEIREENLRSKRETRLNEIRRQILSGTYCVTSQEISAALIDKHLKR